MVGITTDSAAPTAARDINNGPIVSQLAVSGVARVASDHIAIPIPIISRGDILDSAIPTGSMLKPYPTENTEEICPFISSFIPSSSAKGTMATDMATLSNAERKVTPQQRIMTVIGQAFVASESRAICCSSNGFFGFNGIGRGERPLPSTSVSNLFDQIGSFLKPAVFNTPDSDEGDGFVRSGVSNAALRRVARQEIAMIQFRRYEGDFRSCFGTKSLIDISQLALVGALLIL